MCYFEISLVRVLTWTTRPDCYIHTKFFVEIGLTSRSNVLIRKNYLLLGLLAYLSKLRKHFCIQLKYANTFGNSGDLFLKALSFRLRLHQFLPTFEVNSP